MKVKTLGYAWHGNRRETFFGSKNGALLPLSDTFAAQGVYRIIFIISLHPKYPETGVPTIP